MDFKRILTYSAAIEANNNRPWFHENHKLYEEAKGDFYELLELMRFAVGDSSPEIWEQIMYLNVKDWAYRIARDMRYNRDKPPYNPAFRAYISKDKKSWEPIGYYLSIVPGRSCFGTGLWCPDTETINRIRDYLLDNYPRFDRAVAESGLEITGNKLKKMPRGYSDDHPAADWVKYKSWTIMVDIPDEALTDFQQFGELVRRWVTAMEPVRKFLLDAARNVRTQKEIYEEFLSIEK